MLSPDPVIGDMALPQTLNAYSYVGNNPLTFIDPTGYSKADQFPGFDGIVEEPDSYEIEEIEVVGIRFSGPTVAWIEPGIWTSSLLFIGFMGPPVIQLSTGDDGAPQGAGPPEPEDMKSCSEWRAATIANKGAQGAAAGATIGTIWGGTYGWNQGLLARAAEHSAKFLGAADRITGALAPVEHARAYAVVGATGGAILGGSITTAAALLLTPSVLGDSTLTGNGLAQSCAP